MQDRTSIRWFGVEEARKYVPYLLETFERVRRMLEEGRARARRVQSDTLPREEALSRRREVDRLAAQIRAELMKLEEAGIVVKDVDGLVDFPALLGERHVCLCWKYPERSVDFWHELEAGFAGRQPITDADAFARSYLS